VKIPKKRRKFIQIYNISENNIICVKLAPRYYKKKEHHMLDVLEFDRGPKMLVRVERLLFNKKKALGEKFNNECLGKELMERQVYGLDESAFG
jgi:hypothetical protein